MLGGLVGGVAATMPGKLFAAAPVPTGAVQTASGAVRGTRANGVSKFLGIPYGADTSALRFMPPKPAPAWTGVRDCTHFGASSPQGSTPASVSSGRPSAEAGRFLATLFGSPGERPPPSSEDCLFLNVWTPDASPRRKRPVMFWLHGGGFGQGNGSSSMYDGTKLCLRGDVVVVTINHRLSAMGYLYLAGIDPMFADSGNVGQLDQILALRWVSDNIEAFGGDPHNVMIFGESGGGAKVSTLLAMPPARGLFHKAVIQSGPVLRICTVEKSHALAERALAGLNIARGDVRKLQSLPFQAVIGAAMAAQPRAVPGIVTRSLSPVVDGRSLPKHPFDPDAPAISADVPIIIGTCKDETTLFTMSDPQFGKFTADEVRGRFKAALGDRADAAFDLVSKRQPNDAPTYWLTTMLTAVGAWGGSITLAERKYAQRAAPVFMYRLDWETPVMGGALRAPHGLDTALAFDNPQLAHGINGPGPEPIALAADMSQAWINFARTGNPSRKGLAWPAYDPATRKTMMFDRPSHIASDPDRDLREFFT